MGQRGQHLQQNKFQTPRILFSTSKSNETWIHVYLTLWAFIKNNQRKLPYVIYLKSVSLPVECDSLNLDKSRQKIKFNLVQLIAESIEHKINERRKVGLPKTI